MTLSTTTLTDRQALEAEALRLGVGGNAAAPLLAQLTDRQLHEAVLHKRSPAFVTADRTDDAVRAAYDCALKLDRGDEPVSSSGPRRADTQPDFEAELVRTLSELERKRQTAWQPRNESAADGPTREGDAALDSAADFGAELARALGELEHKRRTAAER